MNVSISDNMNIFHALRVNIHLLHFETVDFFADFELFFETQVPIPYFHLFDGFETLVT